MEFFTKKIKFPAAAAAAETNVTEVLPTAPPKAANMRR